MPEFLKRLPETRLPNLWIPKAADFYAVDNLPFTGVNKLDLGKLRKIATELTTQPEPPVPA